MARYKYRDALSFPTRRPKVALVIDHARTLLGNVTAGLTVSIRPEGDMWQGVALDRETSIKVIEDMVERVYGPGAKIVSAADRKLH